MASHRAHPSLAHLLGADHVGVLHLDLERQAQLVGKRAQRTEGPASDDDASNLKDGTVFVHPLVGFGSIVFVHQRRIRREIGSFSARPEFDRGGQ